MNLYTITATNDVKDDYDGFVIAALSADETRRIASEMSLFDNLSVWLDEALSEVVEIGTAREDVEEGVIISSFF